MDLVKGTTRIFCTSASWLKNLEEGAGSEAYNVLA